MSRRKYIFLLLGAFAICAALLFPMLGNPGSTDTTTGGPFREQQQPSVITDEDDIATIHVSVSVSETEFMYWLKINEQFESRHPQLKVILTNEDKGIAAGDWKAAQSDVPFDVMLLDNNQIRAFAVQGYLLPADELYSGDSLADQMEALTEPLKWNGATWGVPLDWNPMLVVWQKGLLQKMGMDAPPAKWDSFLKGYPTLFAAMPDVRAVDIELNDPRQMMAWLGFFQKDAAAAANLGPLNAAMKEQLRFLGEMGDHGASSDSEERIEQLNKKLSGDKLLSAVLPWTTYHSLDLPQDEKSAIALKIEPPAWLGGRSFVLAAQTERLDEARLWIGEMTSSAAELDRFNEFGLLPARKSLYMTEFELGPATNRPPYWLLELLRKRLYEPDPQWQERCERWSGIWNGISAQSFDKAAAEQAIVQWNGIEKEPPDPETTAVETPPPASETDGKLDR